MSIHGDPADCFKDTICDESEWMKSKCSTNDIAEKLEKLNKVRESLYSRNGWSSKNVDQASVKWVDVESNDGQKYSLWDTQHTSKSCFLFPDATFITKIINSGTNSTSLPFHMNTNLLDTRTNNDAENITDEKPRDENVSHVHLKMKTLNLGSDIHQ